MMIHAFEHDALCPYCKAVTPIKGIFTNCTRCARPILFVAARRLPPIALYPVARLAIFPFLVAGILSAAALPGLTAFYHIGIYLLLMGVVDTADAIDGLHSALDITLGRIRHGLAARRAASLKIIAGIISAALGALILLSLNKGGLS